MSPFVLSLSSPHEEKPLATLHTSVSWSQLQGCLQGIFPEVLSSLICKPSLLCLQVIITAGISPQALLQPGAQPGDSGVQVPHWWPILGPLPDSLSPTQDPSPVSHAQAEAGKPHFC